MIINLGLLPSLIPFVLDAQSCERVRLSLIASSETIVGVQLFGVVCGHSVQILLWLTKH